MFSKYGFILVVNIFISGFPVYAVGNKQNFIRYAQFIQEFSHLYNNKFVVLVKPENESDGRVSTLLNIHNVFSRSLKFYTTTHDFSNFFNSFTDDRNLRMTTVFTHVDSIKIPELNKILSLRKNLWLTWLCEIPSNGSLSKLKELKPEINSKFFLVNWIEGNRAEILEMYRIPRRDEEVVRYFGEWNAEDGLIIEEKDLMKRRENLGGNTLKFITYTNQYDEVCTRERLLKNHISYVECFSCHLWIELGKRFNFTTEYVVLNVTKNEIAQVAKALQRNEGDSGTPVYILTSARSLNNTFLWPLLTARIKLLTGIPAIALDFSSFTKPFSDKFWFALLAWLTLTGIILALIVYISDRLIYRKKTSSSDFFEMFYIPFQAICDQGCNFDSSLTGIRIALLVCYILPVFFLNAYSGGITSSLAHPNTIPFQTLTGFEKNGQYKLEAIQKTYFEKMLREDPVFRRYREKSMIADIMPNHASEAIYNVCSKKVTLLGEIPLISPSPIYCNVYIMHENMGTHYAATAVASNFTFVEPINRYLQKRLIRGIHKKELAKTRLNRFKFETSMDKYTAKSSDAESLEPAAIENLTLLFTILLSGISLSIAFFMLEIWHNSTRNRKNVPRKKFK